MACRPEPWWSSTRLFGKGRHPAALDLGDCFTDALAQARDESILCVGGDFARRDIYTVP
jgi:ribonuclease VapC